MDLWGAETPAAHRRMGHRDEEFYAPWLSWLAFDEAGSFEGENHLMYRRWRELPTVGKCDKERGNYFRRSRLDIRISQEKSP